MPKVAQICTQNSARNSTGAAASRGGCSRPCCAVTTVPPVQSLGLGRLGVGVVVLVRCELCHELSSELLRKARPDAHDAYFDDLGRGRGTATLLWDAAAVAYCVCVKRDE